MTPLERELQAIGPSAFPETPDIAAAVLAGIEPAPRGGLWLPRRRALALALVALAVALGAAFAVPQARSGILRWFGIGGVHVQRVETLPTVPPGARLRLGARTSLDDARRAVAFTLFVPSLLGAPDEVWHGHFATDEVTLLYLRDGRISVLTEAQGRLNVEFAGKLVRPGTTVERLELDGQPALWIAGKPHAFFFTNPSGAVVSGTLRLAGNTLLWQHDGVVLRLEGVRTRARAVEIARSVR